MHRHNSGKKLWFLFGWSMRLAVLSRTAGTTQLLDISAGELLVPFISRQLWGGGGHDQIGHLQSSWWGAPSLMRGWACNLFVQFAPPIWRVRSLFLWSRSRSSYNATDSQSASLGVGPPLEQMTIVYISLSDSYFFSFSCRARWKEGSVICSAVTQVQCQVTLRPKVCRPVCFGAGPPQDLNFFVWQSRPFFSV
jgi:hypothetical protein